MKFDRKGNWESVEGEYTVVPESVVPAEILKWIKTKHTGKNVTSISKDSDGMDKGYEIELDNVLEVRFDYEGRFVRYDD